MRFSLNKSGKRSLDRWHTATLCAVFSVVVSGLTSNVHAEPVWIKPPVALVTTLAGSGEIGIADGQGVKATFARPMGLAVDRHDTIYVADAWGQRIRSITRSGTVTTVAGSGSLAGRGLRVPGGHQDGPALRARFNDPVAVAVDSGGRVFVADHDNRCIRVVENGVVSTYSGTVGQSGHEDGDRRHATYSNPTAIAIGKGGVLYVADVGVGIRRVDASGNVSTMPLPYDFKPEPQGISITEASDGEHVFVSYVDGVVELTQNGPNLFPRDELVKSPHEYRDGNTPLGDPGALVGLAPGEFLSADPTYNTVRYVNQRFGGVLIGDGAENAAFTSAGFRDGPANQALLNSPMGIAILRDGRIVIADSRNHRIRIMQGPERRHAYVYPDFPDEKEFVSQRYRIAFVSNSFAWYDTMWPESIPGTIESRLLRDRAALNIRKQPHVTAIRISGVAVGALASYITTTLGQGNVDTIVWMVDPYVLFGEVNSPEGDRQIVAQMKDAYAEIRRNKAHVLLVLRPLEETLGQAAFTHEDVARDDISRMEAIARSTGIPTLDLCPRFVESARTGMEPSMYASGGDFHFSQYGNYVTGSMIAERLEKLRPWQY